MNTQQQTFLKRRCLLGLGAITLAAFSASIPLQAAEIASASISATLISPGEYQYNVTLSNTGTTTVGTFWFAWVPGDDFMSVSPTAILSPAGWNEQITHGGPTNGYGIQWVASTAANDLAAGSSLTGFSFDSSLAPVQLLGAPSGHPADLLVTSFVYSGTPFSDAGFQFNASVAPEPAETGLIALGLGVFVAAINKRRAKN